MLSLIKKDFLHWCGIRVLKEVSYIFTVSWKYAIVAERRLWEINMSGAKYNRCCGVCVCGCGCQQQ